MKTLFLFQTFSFEQSTIYLDLIRAVRDAGHEVTVIAGTSDRDMPDGLQIRESIHVLYLKLEDQFGAGRIRKGLIQVSIGRKMKELIRTYLWDEHFDITVYPTPPITLADAAEMCRRHYKCVNYLMLKDIFPQNAVDIHMMKKEGMLHKYFRYTERKLYRVSDRIGCMSEANIRYIREHEDASVAAKLELFPNTAAIKDIEEDGSGISSGNDTVSFMIGGNLGRPQAIDFLLKGIAAVREQNVRFVFTGQGTEAERVRKYIAETGDPRTEFHEHMPRDKYEELLKKCDIGIVSLRPDFTIPNFPSRSLSYMQIAKPIFAVTDRVSDIKDMISSAGCGWWCPSDDIGAFTGTVTKIISERDRFVMFGRNGRQYLMEHFDVRDSVKILERAAVKNE